MDHSKAGRDNEMTLSDVGKESAEQEGHALCEETDGAEKPNFENVYDLIGGYGKFQKLYIGLLLVSGLSV